MLKRQVISILIIICLVIIGLVACNTNDSNDDTISVVNNYLLALKDNDTETLNSLLWTLNDTDPNNTLGEELEDSVLDLTLDTIEISEDETKRIKEQYIGSELAETYNWSEEYINENMIAILAKYNIDYDNTKVFYDGGDIVQYFYLIRKDADSSWLIWNQSYEIHEK